MRLAVRLLVLLLIGGCGSREALLEETPGEPERTPPQAGAPPEIERPYDEGVDAQARIDAAVASSREDGKRVLLVFGANWCVWCRRLEWVFRNDEAVSRKLARSYHVVHVDVGPRGSSANREVAARYGDPVSNGLPCLVVLDAEGGVEHVQETGSLEDGDGHDPALVLAFLNRWSPGEAAAAVRARAGGSP